MAAQHKTPAECLLIGGPLHGKAIASSGNAEHLFMAGVQYNRHVAVHPKNRRYRRTFYFHAALPRNNPMLLEAVATWITGISPTQGNNPARPKRPATQRT